MLLVFCCFSFPPYVPYLFVMFVFVFLGGGGVLFHVLVHLLYFLVFVFVYSIF